MQINKLRHVFYVWRCAGVNGAVQYSISPPPPHGVIRVDPRDGSLYLQQTLDRELNSTFHLVLTATDGGLPKLSSTAVISLHGQHIDIVSIPALSVLDRKILKEIVVFAPSR